MPFSLLQFLEKLIEKGILSLLSSSSLPGLSQNRNIQAPPPPTSCPLSESPVTSLSSVPITCQQHLAADHRLVFGFWALLLHWWIPPYSFAGSCPSYCPLGCTRPPLWISPSPHTLPRICFQSSDCPSSPEPFHSQFCLLSHLFGLLPWMS